MFNKINDTIIIQYLKTKRADAAPHIKSGSLLDHLTRVKEKLEQWEVPRYTVEAGLCHSVYGTEIYTNKIFLESEKDDFEALISKKAASLINQFSKMKRGSLSYRKESDTGYYIDRYKNSTVEIPKEDLIALVHILIANELDHVTVNNYISVESNLKIYQPFFDFLTEKAKKELFSIVKPIYKNQEEEYLTYIGHASVWIQTKKLSLITDPWFFSSTFQNPVLHGLQPGQKTIDFAIPKPNNDISEINPDVILISHFHTHHSPFNEIKYFATQKCVHIICPTLNEKELSIIESSLGSDTYKNIIFTFIEKDTTIETHDASIFVFTHTIQGHLGFLVSTKTFNVVHLSDASANKNLSITSLDPLWSKLENFRNIDHLFVSAVNHAQLKMHGEERQILEHVSLSPVQACNITKLINPKAVSLIGMSNFSIWDSGIEYTESPESILKQFAWALRFLAPTIDLVPLSPGQIFTKEFYNERHYA